MEEPESELQGDIYVSGTLTINLAPAWAGTGKQAQVFRASFQIGALHLRD